jgi:uncharacterized OsmC-like protein
VGAAGKRVGVGVGGKEDGRDSKFPPTVFAASGAVTCLSHKVNYVVERSRYESRYYSTRES